jgi:methionine sulfoxide reductase heme-binding subunit
LTNSDPMAHVWWLASRSAGVVAFVLLSASVVLGLAMALKLAPTRARPALRVTHERVALLALSGVAAHGLLLLGDSYLHPGLSGVLLPFVMGYRPAWTAFGIAGGYLAAALSLTYYLRRSLGARRWRNAHRFIPVAWALAAVHVIGAGTDAGSLWLELVLAFTLGSVGALLGYRVLGGRPRPTAAARPTRAAAGR